MADDSWAVEMAEFLEDIRLEREPAAGLHDAIAALTIVGKSTRSPVMIIGVVRCGSHWAAAHRSRFLL